MSSNARITGKYNTDIFQVFLTIPELKDEKKNCLPTDTE